MPSSVKGVKRGFAISAWFLGSVLLSVAKAAGDTCADIEAVLTAKGGFEDLRGAPAADEKWRITLNELAGVGNCLLKKDREGTSIIRCESKLTKDEQAARAHQAAVTNLIQKCPGAPWDVSSANPVESLSMTMLRRPGSPVLLSTTLNRWGFSSPFEWQVSLNATMFATKEEKANLHKEAAKPVSLGWRATGQVFCEELTKVIAGARDKFESMKGRKVRSHWMPMLTISGLDECAISALDSGLVYYHCKAIDDVGESESRQVFDALSADVQACLVKPWVPRKRMRNGLPITSFSHPVETAEVTVKMSELGGDYAVKLDIDAE